MTNILLYDLETSPLLGWAYQIWDARIIKVEEQPKIMSVSWKWLGDTGCRTRRPSGTTKTVSYAPISTS